ncbi:MAG: hypothetical protein R6W73_03295 [Candidatus Saliniplasma sp.]
MKDLIEKYFDTPEKKAKLYILITIGQIWAVIAMIIGIIVFVFILFREMGLF